MVYRLPFSDVELMPMKSAKKLLPWFVAAVLACAYIGYAMRPGGRDEDIPFSIGFPQKAVEGGYLVFTSMDRLEAALHGSKPVSVTGDDEPVSMLSDEIQLPSGRHALLVQDYAIPNSPARMFIDKRGLATQRILPWGTADFTRMEHQEEYDARHALATDYAQPQAATAGGAGIDPIAPPGTGF